MYQLPTVTVTAADVEWIDARGDAQCCGHMIAKSDVLALTEPADRRTDGRLTVAARERIAGALTARNPGRTALAPAIQDSHGAPIVWRECGG